MDSLAKTVCQDHQDSRDLAVNLEHLAKQVGPCIHFPDALYMYKLFMKNPALCCSPHFPVQDRNCLFQVHQEQLDSQGLQDQWVPLVPLDSQDNQAAVEHQDHQARTPLFLQHSCFQSELAHLWSTAENCSRDRKLSSDRTRRTARKSRTSRTARIPWTSWCHRTTG